MTGSQQRAAKAVLAVVSLVLLVSMAGPLLLPLLVPAHLWAADTSRTTAARLLWSALPSVATGMVAWALVYVAAGEQRPTIWLVPLVAAMATAAAISRRSRSSRSTPRTRST